MSACLVVLGLLVGCAGGAGDAAVAAVVPGAPGAAVARSAPDRVQEDAWLAEDKLRHFTVSAAATTMGHGAARFALDADDARLAAAGVALALGVGKELVDRRRGGPFSLKDLVWDVAGIAAGIALVHRTR